MSAKIIWKATQNEHDMRYELAVFQYWLSHRKSSPTYPYTFQDLRLTKINSIVTHLIWNTTKCSPETKNIMNNSEAFTMDEFIQSLAHRTIAAFQERIAYYTEKILNEKEKLSTRREHPTNQSYIDDLLKCIDDRQLNMIHRAQYNVEQRLKTFAENKV